jgi:hypothetical protein
MDKAEAARLEDWMRTKGATARAPIAAVGGAP